MTAVVPDASVLLKWVLPGPPEEDARKALALREQALRGRVELVAPSLWIFEAGNTLARRFPDKAEHLLTALVHFGIKEAPLTHEWRRTAVDLVHRHGVTFYDAAYHAAALVRNAVFVTADARYVARAQSSGAVVPLASFTP